MLVPSLTFLNHFIVTKLSKSRTPLQDGLLALVLKVSFIVHLRERSLSCDSNFGILAKQSRQFTALSESETSLKAHVFSKKSRHSLDISRNGTRKNCIRSTHYIPSSRAGIHPFYLANDCTFFSWLLLCRLAKPRGSISNRERRSHLIDLLSSTVVQTDLTKKKKAL